MLHLAWMKREMSYSVRSRFNFLYDLVDVRILNIELMIESKRQLYIVVYSILTRKTWT